MKRVLLGSTTLATFGAAASVTATASVLYAKWDGEAGADADGVGGTPGLNIGF